MITATYKYTRGFHVDPQNITYLQRKCLLIFPLAFSINMSNTNNTIGIIIIMITQLTLKLIT